MWDSNLCELDEKWSEFELRQGYGGFEDGFLSGIWGANPIGMVPDPKTGLKKSKIGILGLGGSKEGGLGKFPWSCLLLIFFRG